MFAIQFLQEIVPYVASKKVPMQLPSGFSLSKEDLAMLEKMACQLKDDDPLSLPTNLYKKAKQAIVLALLFDRNCLLSRETVGKELTLEEYLPPELAEAIQFFNNASGETEVDLAWYPPAIACNTTPGGGVLSFIQRATLFLVKKKAEKLLSEGKKPVIIFDLDDTLFSSDPRTRAIINDFFRVGDTDGKLLCDPACREIADLVSYLPSYGVDYDQMNRFADMLKEAYKDDPEKLKRALETIPRLTGYWVDKFFSSGDYLQYDQPWPDGVQYVNELFEMGVKIIYVTARKELVRKETIESLAKHGYPVPQDSRDQIGLLMKPNNETDADFKKNILVKAATENKEVVTTIFENTLRNLIAMEAPPEVLKVFIPRLHWDGERKMPLPKGYVVISDFRE